MILVRLHFAGMTGLLLLRQFSKALLFLFVFFYFQWNILGHFVWRHNSWAFDARKARGPWPNAWESSEGRDMLGLSVGWGHGCGRNASGHGLKAKKSSKMRVLTTALHSRDICDEQTWTSIYIYDIYIYIKSYGYSYSNYICICNIYVSNIIHIVHILILLLNFYFWIPFWNCHFALSFRSLSGCNRGCQRTDPTHPHGQGTETSDTWSSSPSLLNLESGMLPLDFQQISHNFQGLVIVDLLLPWFPCFICEFSGCLCCRTGATPRHHKNFEEPPGAK